jgi:hypothetical protein
MLNLISTDLQHILVSLGLCMWLSRSGSHVCFED